MRFDSYGFFWEDKPRTSSREPVNRPIPAIPDTGWTAPTDFPNLSAAKVLAIDLETYDPNLKTSGPGNVRLDGNICGIAVGADDDGRWYFPMRHTVGGGNLDPEAVLNWARHELGRASQPKVGANLMYDLGWLDAEGVEVRGELIDVQFAEALLNEHAFSYSLQALAKQYLNEGKVNNAMYEWAEQAYGGKAQGGNIYRCPAALVGPYGEGDVDLPLRIWQRQKPLLEKEGLLDLFKLECALMPMLLAMRKRGVRVSTDNATEVSAEFLKREAYWQGKLDHAAGQHVDIWAAESISKAFDKAGLSYPTTAKSKKPSFTKPWLMAHDSELAQAVMEARKYNKNRGTFVDGFVSTHNINGRIHAEAHPLRKVSEEGGTSGTVSGRFSYSNPNLQQIPARDIEMKKLIRGMFVPDEGDKQWRCYDYSQIEYRLMAHYAIGEGSDDVRQQYADDPKTDFHEATRQLIYEMTGKLMDRKPAKGINFGLAYGMQENALARHLGLPKDEAIQLMHHYHTGVPFVKRTFDACSDRAVERGYVKTLLGRRGRFPFWEANDYELGKELGQSLDPDKLLAQINAARDLAVLNQKRAPRAGVRRARTHKALNSVMQGGAADLMKKAMLDIWQSGVCDVVGVPLITVHDELDFSDPGTAEAEEAFKDIAHMMENAIQLKVPIIVDCEIGPNWGNLK